MIAEGESRHGFYHWDRSGQNTGVMAASGFEFDILEIRGDRLLRMEDGGGRLESHAEQDVLPVRDSTLNSSGAVGCGAHPAFAHPEGVIVGLASEEGTAKPRPDLETLRSR